MWTAHVTLNRDYPPRPRPGVLHLWPHARQDATDVTAAADFAAFVAAHREIGAVLVYDSRFPQRQVEWRRFVEKHSRKIWPDAELLAAFQEAERRAVADPNHTPTLAEALRNPKEFVDGMTEAP
jgi:hypothetical protein